MEDRVISTFDRTIGACEAARREAERRKEAGIQPAFLKPRGKK